MLDGERVLLRAVTREDLLFQAQWENDLETVLLADDEPPRPRSLEQLQARFDRDAQEEPKPGGSVWFTIEVDGVPIGGCGLYGMDVTDRTCCLGISIGNAEYRGRGYGRDAVRTLVDYAFRYHNLRKVGLTLGSHNERAYRCYLACGFQEEGRLKEQEWCAGRYVDRIYMAVFARDWDSRS